MKPVDRQLLIEAWKALDELSSVFQAIGGIAAAARRCKPDSKRGKELWAAYDKLNNEGAAHSSKIRMALGFASGNRYGHFDPKAGRP
jgi:hypothetical protein